MKAQFGLFYRAVLGLIFLSFAAVLAQSSDVLAVSDFEFQRINANPGTKANKLAKLSGSPAAATNAAVSDTGGVIGICVAGCGNSGSATIKVGGPASCSFDGSTTAGDYVQISSKVAGDCHDVGATYPTSGQV